MERIDRRSFLSRTLCTAVGAAAVSRTAARAAPATEPAIPMPCPPSAWRKHGIALEPTEPWEGDHIQDFTCPVEPIDKDRWRIWYSVCGSHREYTLAYAEGVPGGPWKKFAAQCSTGRPADAPFAIGNLPASWKPVQVIHIRLRNGGHRIYFWVHGEGTLRYLAADSDDGRRYSVIHPLRPVLYHFHDRAAYGVASPDGAVLHTKPAKDRPADEPAAIPRLISNDATNIYQREDGSFELYSVALVPVPKTDPAYMAHDNAPGLLRVIDRYTSADGLHFETRQRVIRRDAEDPVDQQFYYLAVTYTPQGRVGMLGHYRCQAQTMDIEWCFSADGAKWHRPLRCAWVPRGDRTQPDSYGIYAPNGLVQRDGRWHLFYTAVNSAHNEKDSYGRPRTLVMHATTESIWA